MGLEDIEKIIKETIPHVKSALAFESLDNLVKGGRLSKTVGIIGNILGLRLILSIVDGEMTLMDKVRGGKKAAKCILDFVENKGIRQGEISAVLQVENKDIVETIRNGMVDKGVEFIECEVGCVVGTHSGPGACGVFFIENY